MKQPVLSFSDYGLKHVTKGASASTGQHSVSFYDRDEHLVGMLREFVESGLDASQNVIVIATAEHLNGLQHLGRGRSNSSQRAAQYYPVDAGEALDKILVDGKIDAQSFHTLFDPLMGAAFESARPVRVFGEMVALLVEKGCCDAALELEELWNNFRQDHPFSVLCAYPMRNFESRSTADLFKRICANHTHVLPPEDCLARNSDTERLRNLAYLQQEARSFRQEAAQKDEAEARCQASESRMRQLIELMPNAVYTCDEAGRITYYNRRAAELWGQAPPLGSDDLKFCGALHLRHLDGRPLARDETPMAKAIREGLSTREGEIVIERPDGLNVIASVNIDPLRDTNGRITGAINVFQDITSRKKTELELQRKEQEVSAFVENASIGLHRVGPDGIIQWANRAELEMFGYSWEEFIGHHVRDFHADLDVADDILARLAKGDRICSREVRMKCKDGSVKYVTLDSSVLWDSGRFVHTQCFTRDITQEREAEELSARLAAIVQTSEDAIFSTDLEGTIRSWNRGAERLYGYSVAEIVGQPVGRLIPPEKQDEDTRIMRILCQGERIDTFESTRRRSDGSIVEVALTVSALRDSSGAVIGASRIVRDITERKRAERRQHALYELVAKVNRAGTLSEIFDTALDAICRCQETERASILLREADGVMRFKAWRGLSDGYRAAVEGHSPWREGESDPQIVVISNIAEAELPPELKTVILSESIRAVAFVPIRYETRLLGKFMLYYSERHEFKNEELLSARTIASQLAFAIERQASGEFLEHLVRERTASLQEAIAQMEEFSYTVSHDLRAPLRGMQAYTDALVEEFSDKLPDTAQKYLRRIKENARRLDRMILDVLTFSRLARADLRLDPVDLNSLVRRIIEQYPGMQEPQAEITFQPLPVVIGHEPSLTQAISNLLTNAVKFVAPGVKPRVRIWAEPRNETVRVWLEDNGIGIDPKIQHRLFSMFERAHPKLSYEGTGVGLAIVRKAMERIGGKAGVESDGLNGSRFWIEAKPLRAIESLL